MVTFLVTRATKLAVCQSTGALLEEGKGKLPLVRVSYCYRGKLLVSYWQDPTKLGKRKTPEHALASDKASHITHDTGSSLCYETACN